MKEHHKTIRLGDGDIAWLERYREPFSIQLREELRLVRSILLQGEAGIAGKLTVGEACLVVDVLNGTLMDPAMLASYAELLAASVSDGCSLDGLDAKWGIERASLVAKIRDMTTLEALAVVHLARVFWSDPNAEEIRKRVSRLFRCSEDDHDSNL